MDTVRSAWTYLDRAANVAILIFVAACLALMAGGGLRHRASPQGQVNLVGTRISLKNTSFKRQTLVLAISTSCRFCKDSMPFYRDLTLESHGKTDIVAVLPQPIAEAKKFLAQSDVEVAQVISSSLAEVNIYATPTLLMVGPDAKVQHVWVGLLNDVDQKQILSAIKQ